MTILTIHEIDETKLQEVMAVAQEVGSVTLNAYYDGETCYMLEGVHRTEAAKRLGLPLIIVCKEWDDVISTDCEDCNDFDYDTRTAKVSDIYEYGFNYLHNCGVYSENDFASVEVI